MKHQRFEGEAIIENSIYISNLDPDALIKHLLPIQREHRDCLILIEAGTAAVYVVRVSVCLPKLIWHDSTSNILKFNR